ncbi:hypothetical protein HanOQP8_Chr10g0367141 [Helianthus annuus]|nr:hypothetical protein HanOQP8_Chr10g0367141 [Helianthus annuus]
MWEKKIICKTKKHMLQHLLHNPALWNTHQTFPQKTISIPIPKSKRKTKKGIFGVEKLEVPIVTQMQQTSPPIQTPPSSSQKESVVNTGEPNQEGDISLESLLKPLSHGCFSFHTSTH